MISLIAIIGKNRELGKNNKLIWNVPGDLKRFKQLTSGHPVIMGRNTFQSIGRPLPNRTNIVVTSDTSFSNEGIIVANSIQYSLEQAKDAPGSEEIFIIGGGKIYAQTIDHADRLYLTIVDATADADTYFPDYSSFTHIIETQQEQTGELSYRYITLGKKM